MIRIGICDDSYQTLIQMKELVKKYFSGKRVNYSIHCYSSGHGLLKENIEFDIVFLGIELSGINGIEIAEQLRKSYLKTKIIYVTNYLKYQTSAFQVHAFQYILKPLSEKKVCQVISEALRYIEETDKKYTLTFCSDQGFIRLKAPDIIYLEYKNRKIHIVAQHRNYVMNRTLRKAYDDLKCRGFGMPHKSFIVNYDNIHRIKGYEITMKNGIIVPMAQRRAVGFKKDFYEYLNETYYLL